MENGKCEIAVTVFFDKYGLFLYSFRRSKRTFSAVNLMCLHFIFSPTISSFLILNFTFGLILRNFLGSTQIRFGYWLKWAKCVSLLLSKYWQIQRSLTLDITACVQIVNTLDFENLTNFLYSINTIIRFQCMEWKRWKLERMSEGNGMEN